VIGDNDRWYVIEEQLFNLQPKLDELNQQVIRMHLAYLNDIYQPQDVQRDEDRRLKQYFELNLFLSMHQQIQKRVLDALAICGAAHEEHGKRISSAKDYVQEQRDNHGKESES